MNITEFSALKVGDQVQNLMNAGTPPGEVTKVNDKGVFVRWSASSPEYHYPAAGTAWFHWTAIPKVDDAPAVDAGRTS